MAGPAPVESSIERRTFRMTIKGHKASEPGGKPPYVLTSEMMKLVSEISELAGIVVAREARAPLKLQLRRDLQIRTIYSSLLIEGNKLTLDEFQTVINGKNIRGNKIDVKEAKNAHKAYSLIDKLDPYNLGDLLLAHETMMSGVIPTAGRFRSGNVGVFDGEKLIHQGTPAFLVHGQISQLLGWARRSEDHPLIKSGAVHYELEFIHPFADGNGRMGRLWQTLILSKWRPVFGWLPTETIIHERQQRYYDALANCGRKVDCAEFIELMLLAIREALANYNQAAELEEGKTVQVERLMEAIGDDTLSAKELIERLGLRSRQSFVTWYLRPALDLGLVEMTIPGKPNSPAQKYRRAARSET